MFGFKLKPSKQRLVKIVFACCSFGLKFQELQKFVKVNFEIVV